MDLEEFRDLEEGDTVTTNDGATGEVVDFQDGQRAVVELENTDGTHTIPADTLTRGRGDADDADGDGDGGGQSTQAIDGIGEQHAADLADEGIDTVDDVLDAGVDGLQDAGVSQGNAETWYNDAEDLAG